MVHTVYILSSNPCLFHCVSHTKIDFYIMNFAKHTPTENTNLWNIQVVTFFAFKVNFQLVSLHFYSWAPVSLFFCSVHSHLFWNVLVKLKDILQILLGISLCNRHLGYILIFVYLQIHVSIFGLQLVFTEICIWRMRLT